MNTPNTIREYLPGRLVGVERLATLPALDRGVTPRMSAHQEYTTLCLFPRSKPGTLFAPDKVALAKDEK